MLYDLIIVGGGPAGATAAIYAARQKLKTLLIAKSFGGQMARKVVSIENYPGYKEISGFELIQKFVDQINKESVEILTDSVLNIAKQGDEFSVLTGSKKEYKSQTVLIASGADPRPLEVPGEKEFIGKGVSYCVACDGPLYAGKSVVVVGGGYAGFEAALFLTNIVEKIYLLEFGAKVKAGQDLQEKAKKSGKIEVITSAAVKELKGQKFLEEVLYEDINSKEIKTLPVQGIFIEIGSQPATVFVKDLVDFSDKDEIVVDPKTCQTKTPGLFAAGDVADFPFKQIVVATGLGAAACLSISNYLQKHGKN